MAVDLVMDLVYLGGAMRTEAVGAGAARDHDEFGRPGAGMTPGAN